MKQLLIKFFSVGTDCVTTPSKALFVHTALQYNKYTDCLLSKVRKLANGDRQTITAYNSKGISFFRETTKKVEVAIHVRAPLPPIKWHCKHG